MKAKHSDTSWIVRGGLVTFIFAMTVHSASAQTTLPPPGGIAPPSRAERPYRGLFGSGVGNTSQSLTVEGKIGGGFVENPLADQLGPVRPGDSGASGASGVGSALLSYSFAAKRWGVQASYTSLVDYYPQMNEGGMQQRHIVTATAYYMPTASTRMAFTENFKNFPEFSFSDLFDPDLELTVPVNSDLGFNLVRYTRFGHSMEVTQRFSNRTRFTADIGYAHGKVEAREWVIITGSATLTHNIAKGLALSLGYQEGTQYDVNTPVPQPKERQPRIRAGVDFDRPISFSRRTKVSFSSGLAGMEDRATGVLTYHIIGSARVEREFGRSWLAGVTYNRGLRHIEPIREALLSDSITTLVQGSFSKRIQFQSHVGLSWARLGVNRSKFDTKLAGISVSAAMNKLLALGADYSYYRISQPIADLPLANSFTKTQRFSTYVQIWVPLITRTKRD